MLRAAADPLWSWKYVPLDVLVKSTRLNCGEKIKNNAQHWHALVGLLAIYVSVTDSLPSRFPTRLVPLPLEFDFPVVQLVIPSIASWISMLVRQFSAPGHRQLVCI